MICLRGSACLLDFPPFSFSIPTFPLSRLLLTAHSGTAEAALIEASHQESDPAKGHEATPHPRSITSQPYLFAHLAINHKSWCCEQPRSSLVSLLHRLMTHLALRLLFRQTAYLGLQLDRHGRRAGEGGHDRPSIN